MAFGILTVCTGNVCRSPLAQLILTARLGGLGARVSSAGTEGLDRAPMTEEAQRLAALLGAAPQAAAAHRSHALVEADLAHVDLVLTMTRAHRRAVAELSPVHSRAAFTAREFARLAATVDQADLRRAVESAGPEAAARVRAMAAVVSSRRGLAPPAADPADDDVADPYRRPWQAYQRMAVQLVPALREVERAVRAALSPP